MSGMRQVKPMTAKTAGVPARRHSYAVVDGTEHALEVSSAFALAGLAGSERVTLIGLTRRRADSVLARLREDGADPDTALRDGQLAIADPPTTEAVYRMSDQHLADEIGRQATAAVRDGYRGLRLGGLLLGVEPSPHERTLTRMVRAHPVTVLCLFHPQITAAGLADVHALHDRGVSSTAVLDDGQVRVSTVPGRALRVAGRIHPGNRALVLSILTDSAREGRRTIDAASLRQIDPESLHTILTCDLGLTLRRPHPEVQRITRELAARTPPAPSADTTARNGVPARGQTAPEVVSNLIWRTFGHTRPGRAESVLDWAGLLDGPAAPVAQVAARHRIAPATLTNRARQVTRRGAQTPLSPLLLRDAGRATQPTEDHLSRQRTAQLLGLPPPPQR